MAAVSRAGRRAAFHLLQAAIEGLKAVEAVIEEIGGIADDEGHHNGEQDHQKIDIE